MASAESDASRAFIWKTSRESVAGSVAGDQVESPSFREVFREILKTLPRSGGRIELSADVYEVESTVEIDRPLRLCGTGGGNTTSIDNMTLLKAHPNLDGPVVEVTGQRAHNGQMHGSGFFDLGIVGQSDGSQTDCLRLRKEGDANLSNMFFERLMIDGAGRHGMNFEDAKKHHQIRDVWVGHCGKDGLVIRTGYRYWITNSYFYDSGRHGVNIEGASDVNVLAPHARRNQSAGVRVTSDQFKIIGGRVEGNRTGVLVEGNHGLISQGEYLNNTEAGIQVGTSRSEAHKNRIALNRFATGSPGHLRARLDLHSREVSPVEKFAHVALDEGFEKALKKTGDFTLRKVRDTFRRDDEPRAGVGISISERSEDTRLLANSFDDISRPLNDKGTRTIVENTGYNQGDPRQEGEWYQQGQEGVEVWDRQNEKLYKYIQGGWRGPFQGQRSD